MKKVLFIGRSGSGKTTLCQYLHHQKLAYHKTQAVQFYDHAVDTPGEYLENRSLYRALITTAADCDMIALLCDATAPESLLPPNFGQVFNKPIIGIVTKSVLADEKAIEKAKDSLWASGADKIFVVDTLARQGLAPLEEALAIESR